MRRILPVVVLCLIAFPAQAFQVSCDDVRAYVAKYGRIKAIAFAIENGATWHDIREARKCLR
jgi:hypothetical protein